MEVELFHWKVKTTGSLKRYNNALTPWCMTCSSDMPLHVRRSSDPALMTINGPFSGGESRVQPDETPSRKNPTRWSTTAGFLKARHSSGTNSLERKVGAWMLKPDMALCKLILNNLTVMEEIAHTKLHEGCHCLFSTNALKVPLHLFYINILFSLQYNSLKAALCLFVLSQAETDHIEHLHPSVRFMPKATYLHTVV